MAKPVLWRRDEGDFGLAFGPELRADLLEMCDMLESLIEERGVLTKRLFPPPYGDDAERNDGYAALAGPELVERRLASIEVVRSTVRADRIDEDGLMAWMRTINDMRLVLGTILGITDDDDYPEPTTETLPVWEAYETLGAILEGIVGVLAG